MTKHLLVTRRMFLGIMVPLLEFILNRLQDNGLTPNQDKFRALGSTPDACTEKPNWPQEPTIIESHDGVKVQARGIEI